MPNVGKTAADYSPEGLLRVRGTCLYIVSQIPRALAEDITVVGGLVPSLLIGLPPESGDPHLGTADLDIGLSLELRGEQHYNELANKLNELGFQPEKSEGGRASSVRWRSMQPINPEILIDVLPVAQLADNRRIPALNYRIERSSRFFDRERVNLNGECIMGVQRQASVWVCGPGAYIVIKALTFANRNLNKDAYDLYFVLKNYGAGVHDIFPHLAPLLKFADARRALSILQDDFADPNGDGAAAVPLFLFGEKDENMQADVSGHTRSLLQSFGMA